MNERLWNRLDEAKEGLAPIQSPYRVVYEGPNAQDEPAKVLIPDPNLRAAAKEGGILPVVSAFHDAVYRLTVQFPDDQPVSINVRGIGKSAARTDAIRQGARIISEIVVSAPWHSAERAKPMTEHETIDYLIQKDIDYSVWGAASNRQRFKVITVDDLPKDRSARNSWELV